VERRPAGQAALAQAQITLSRKRVDEACIAAVNAEKEAKRQGELREGLRLDQPRRSRRTEAEVRRAACNTAKADVAQAEAKFKATRVEQGRVALYAPFDGTVAKIVGELGEYSTPSPPGVPTPPAIDLIDDSCLYVKAPMDEVDAPEDPDWPAGAHHARRPARQGICPARCGASHPMSRRSKKQARTVDIEVDFDQPEEAGKLLVGYSADVEIILAGRDKVLRIPTAAIQEGGKVLVFNADSGKLEERRSRPAWPTGNTPRVLEGLQAGERIVTSLDKEGVKAGAKVTPDDKGQGQVAHGADRTLRHRASLPARRHHGQRAGRAEPADRKPANTSP
jgi:HlyD family secretion protein